MTSIIADYLRLTRVGNLYFLIISLDVGTNVLADIERLNRYTHPMCGQAAPATYTSYMVGPLIGEGNGNAGETYSTRIE